MTTLDKPRRRTYVTGNTLPALTTSYRAMRIAPDDPDADFASVRAFAVNIRNRASTSIYLRENADSDEVEIAPHEHYPIWEPDGLADFELRGSSGGEQVEVRTIEAHNDFSFTDKVEAFTRAVSHFLGTSRRRTTITGQVGDLDMNINAANVDVPVTLEANNIGNITTSIDAVNATVPVDITSQTISELDFNLSGSTVTQDVDITTQSVGDVRTYGREGFTETRFLRETGLSSNNAPWQWTLENPADYDGSIDSMTVRVYADDDSGFTDFIDGIGARVEHDRFDNGVWDTISPQRAHSTLLAARLGGPDVEARVYDSRRQCVYTYDPNPGLYFEEGDSIRIVADVDGNTQAAGGFEDFSIEISVVINERQEV